MAQLPWEFKPDEVEGAPDGEFSLIPDKTEVTSIITAADIKPTSTGGTMVEIEHTVTGEQYNSRKIWNYLNIVNANEKAEQIGKGQLKAVCKAIGLASCSDTNELLNKPLVIRVGIKKANDPKYKDQNIVTAWKPAGGQTAQASQPQATGASPFANMATQPVQPQQTAQTTQQELDDDIPF